MSGINSKYVPSDVLAEFMGSSRKVTRGEVIKAIWAYAKENDLNTQVKKKGRNWAAIDPDAELSPILGRRVNTVGDIAKNVSKHLFKD